MDTNENTKMSTEELQETFARIHDLQIEQFAFSNQFPQEKQEELDELTKKVADQVATHDL